MALPTSPYQSSSGALHGQSAPPRGSGPASHCKLRTHSQEEGGHQLEKLQFALAVALTRGDLERSDQLRSQIASLGGNREEPGT